MELNNIDESTKAVFGRNIRKHLDNRTTCDFKINRGLINHMLFEIPRTSLTANKITLTFYMLKDKYSEIDIS